MVRISPLVVEVAAVEPPTPALLEARMPQAGRVLDRDRPRLPVQVPPLNSQKTMTCPRQTFAWHLRREKDPEITTTIE